LSPCLGFFAFVQTGWGQNAAAVRELTVGAIDDPAASLTFVAFAAVLSDSILLLSQPVESHLKAFDWIGRPHYTIGREGSGPGEFLGIARIGRIGQTDMAWAHDARHQRISVFDANGVLARSISVQPIGMAMYQSVLPGDTLVALRPAAGNRNELVVIDGTTMRVIHRLTRYTEVASGVRVVVPGGRVTAGSPFRDAPVVTASSAGGHIAVVKRDYPASARADSFSITVFRPNGTSRSGRFEYTPRRVDDTALQLAIDEVVNIALAHRGHPVTTMPRARLRQAIADSLRVPRYMAPVSNALIGSDGRVWLRREAIGPMVRWEVVSTDLQRVLTSFFLPASADARVAEADRIWVVERDEFDVPYVTRYRVPGLGETRRD
jgi:hypothetical protein